MRALHWVALDKRRPALILTRPVARKFLQRVTVAPVTSTIRGLAIEVPVGPIHGLDHDSVINFDNIITVHQRHVGAYIGHLGEDEDRLVLRAIQEAFDLLPPGF